MRKWLLLAAFALPMAVAVWASAAAQAAFPGQNGKIAFARVVESPIEARCIYTANANGTSEAVLLPPCDGDQETNPRWSPDGAQIAYQGYGGQLDLVNADGTNLREFFFDSGAGTTGFGWSPDGTEIAVSWFDCFDGQPCGSRIERLNASTGAYTTILSTEDFVSGADWSPDGKLIAFTRQFQLYVIRPDGTGLAQLAPGSPGDNHSPSWSPNAGKIAFVSSRDGNQEIYVMNADGTGQTRLTDNVSFDGSPRWSPDGTKIIFETDRDDDQEIYVMNANGTGQTRVTNTLGYDSAPDWQPIPINGYVRPKNAVTLRVPLVPAYSQCVTSNRLHGPPLDSASCNPPDLVSSQLTLGGPESNGKPANFTGFVRYKSLPGNTGTPTVDEADVALTVQLTDVLRQGTLADYDGELSLKTTIRRTDRENSPHPGGAGAGTVSFHWLRATVPCVPTLTDPNVGATCALSTTFDALVPGSVTENKRTVWGVDTVQVEDGGADNDAETLGDNTLFATQGVFVP
jgi:hypothetical protein